MIKISYIKFNNVSKKYKNNIDYTIKDFNLSIKKGEFIVVVGPSGSGKSTLLQLICGFEELTEGTIEIDNKVINDIEPKDRDVSMVFQNYALFPHMTVYENIEFGMKMRKIDKLERGEKVKYAARILGLSNLLDSKPNNLSGGQKQRVGIGRAMVKEPKLFLMDEPLSSLDAKLRYLTSNEIRKLHKDINSTTIYVTHDQTEALSMADRIVVLNNGEVQQVGNPFEIYNNPKNIFVAKFIGTPEMNMFSLVYYGNRIILNNSIELDINYNIVQFLEIGKEYILGLRPENIKINDIESKICANIFNIEYLGGESIVYLQYNNYNFTSRVYNAEQLNLGDKVNISFNLDKGNLFDKDTQQNILI